MEILVKKNLLWFLLLSVPLAFLVGSRGETNDTYTYYSIFKNISYYDLTNFGDFYLETGVELGWGLYSKVISLFSNSPVVLFSVFSLLIFYFIYKICNIIKLKFIYVMCFYLPTGFFFMQQFMQIRQALAVPLVVYAAVSFLDGRKKTSTIFFLLALVFHQISIAFIVVFFSYLIISRYYPLDFSVKRFLTLNIIVLMIGFILARLFFLPLAMGLFDRLNAYSDTDYAENVGFLSLANIKFYIEFLIILFFTNSKLISNKFFVFFVFCFTIGLTLRLAFFDFAILSGRLSNAFLFVEVFLIPMLLLNRLSLNFFYLYSFIYFFLLLYVTWNFQAAQYLESAYFIPLS